LTEDPPLPVETADPTVESVGGGVPVVGPVDPLDPVGVIVPGSMGPVPVGGVPPVAPPVDPGTPSGGGAMLPVPAVSPGSVPVPPVAVGSSGTPPADAGPDGEVSWPGAERLEAAGSDAFDFMLPTA
jgi:hypothetical protein